MAALALFLNTMHINQVTCSSDSYPSFCPVHTQNLVFVGSQVIQRSFATSEKQVWSYVSNHRQQLVPERNAVPVLPNRCDQAVINTLREYRHWPSVMLPLLSPEPITLLLSSPTSPKRKAATFFICLQTALRLKFNQLLGRIYYSFLLPCASATQQCMLSSPVVDYKCFSPFNFMVDFQNLEGFHKCHTSPLNVSDCFCYFMKGSSPCKLTCLWTTTHRGLFYLLVSQSFTMLSKEPEISWCSWVGDHFTDVTQPVWEVRDRRTKEPSE